MINNDNINKEIIKWGCAYLSSHNYTLKSNQPENVLNTPGPMWFALKHLMVTSI